MKNKISSSFPEINFSVIIPNYNGSTFIPDCLHSLTTAIKNCPQSHFELIFVDNGSKDNSVDLAKNLTKKFSILDTKYLILDTNQGFASAVNQGINKAKYPYVVVLNNDLTMEPNWFQLVFVAIQNNKDSKITTFFGTVLNKEGTNFESQGLDFKIQGKCLNISNGQLFNKSVFLKSDKLPSEKLVWGAPASLVVYKKDIVQKAGLFDSDFFAYEEDVDLSFRLNKLGYKTLYLPSAISYHLGGGTSNKMGNFRTRMDAKNWIFLIIKNYSAKDFWSHFLSIKIERLRNLSGLIKITIKKYGLLSIFYLPYDLTRTYGNVIISLPKMFQKRHQIKKLLKYHN
jgi:GT2 family glycosyltransferase